jgi:hypothetical protein
MVQVTSRASLVASGQLKAAGNSTGGTHLTKSVMRGRGSSSPTYLLSATASSMTRQSYATNCGWAHVCVAEGGGHGCACRCQVLSSGRVPCVWSARVCGAHAWSARATPAGGQGSGGAPGCPGTPHKCRLRRTSKSSRPLTLSSRTSTLSYWGEGGRCGGGPLLRRSRDPGPPCLPSPNQMMRCTHPATSPPCQPLTCRSPWMSCMGSLLAPLV